MKCNELLNEYCRSLLGIQRGCKRPPRCSAVDQRQTSLLSVTLRSAPLEADTVPESLQPHLIHTHMPDRGQSKLKNLHGVRGGSLGLLRREEQKKSATKSQITSAIQEIPKSVEILGTIGDKQIVALNIEDVVSS